MGYLYKKEKRNKEREEYVIIFDLSLMWWYDLQFFVCVEQKEMRHAIIFDG